MKTRTLFTTLLVLITTSLSFAQTATEPGAGDGSEGNPYEIATLNNLYWLSQNSSEWDKHYIQTADIDASDTENWDGGAGFSPIGIINLFFTGTYDGGHHTITGLYINREGINDRTALFGDVRDAVIKSIGLVDVDISGSRNYTGALVGYASEDITGSTITNCYSTGSIAGNNLIGGLVGRLEGSTINNSFSTASVSGEDKVGGLVGENQNSSTISTSYSARPVNGSNETGGLVGTNSATVTDSYWNTETSGQASSAGGTGLTTGQMGQQASFSGFDFTNNWNIEEGNSFPYLQENIQFPLPGTNVLPPAGDGSVSSPYEIASRNNLNWLSQNPSEWGSHFIQTADIDASESQNWNNGAGFSPIGNGATKFTGTYDGAGYTISGLYINRGRNIRMRYLA